MEKSKEEFVGKTVMEESGTQYFVVGKYKIKVSEHFPERGPVNLRIARLFHAKNLLKWKQPTLMQYSLSQV